MMSRKVDECKPLPLGDHFAGGVVSSLAVEALRYHAVAAQVEFKSKV